MGAAIGSTVLIIGCSGQVGHRTGIGVVQTHLYAYLSDAGHDLVQSAPRDVGTSAVNRVRGLARGLRPASGKVDAYLSVVPPMPLAVSAPVLTVIHDLRWLRTRSAIGARYRGWDLHRAVRRSDALLCISETTRRALVEYDPRAADRAFVQHLGPGLVPKDAFTDSKSGLLMLVGSAPHKRNELAAAALANARPSWVRGIIGVGVSDSVRRSLHGMYQCEWLSEVSERQMISLYQRAEYLMMLGTDEGFGLPFVEAMAAGCQIIAADHRLAREIIGNAGVLLKLGDSKVVGSQLRRAPAVSVSVRKGHAMKFSWGQFGQACEDTLTAIATARAHG